ncbi:MAG TPA: DUF6531 domain-containing protein [Candidatus Acidoferrales bacterium]|nr:DUF6531 domain-containing protein [Candidatus Acidoferrales bacterium]
MSFILWNKAVHRVLAAMVAAAFVLESTGAAMAQVSRPTIMVTPPPFVAPPSGTPVPNTNLHAAMAASFLQPKVLPRGTQRFGIPLVNGRIDDPPIGLDPLAVGRHTLQSLGIKRYVNLRESSSVDARPSAPVEVTPLTGTRSRGALDMVRAAPALRPNANTALRPQNVTLGAISTTGITPWWTYEDDAIPGVGAYMVNVANLNLLVQAADVDIPERGIDLAFRRTYNSQSGRDWNDDDGSSEPGQFGAGWTNTYDAHIAFNSGNANGPGLSIFDSNGTRYDYLPNGSGGWTPPAGQYGVLVATKNGYSWTQKDGTIYYFRYPDPTTAYALAGRLTGIVGRNSGNEITLGYLFSGNNDSSASNLTTITVTHSDGHVLTMNFASFGSQGTLLTSVVEPQDPIANTQPTISYGYYTDSSGNLDLLEVDEPISDVSGWTSGIVPNTPCIPQRYYYGAGHLLQQVVNPRAMLGGSIDQEHVNAADGEDINFTYSGTAISKVDYVGNINPTIEDGSPGGAPLQPAPAPTPGMNDYKTVTFTPYSSGINEIYDTDGHTFYYYYTSADSVWATAAWVGNASVSYLYTYQTWDQYNNLIETLDARGNATDMAYDLNGNVIAIAEPSVTTSQGQFRPTSLFSYDVVNGVTYNNLIAACSPYFTHWS